EAVQPSCLQIRRLASVRRQALASRCVGVAYQLECGPQVPGVALVGQVQADAQLDNRADDGRFTTLPLAALFCPAHRPGRRVLPEVNAMAEPVVVVFALLPIVNAGVPGE